MNTFFFSWLDTNKDEQTMTEELTGKKLCKRCKTYLPEELKDKHDAYNATREPQFTHGINCQCCYHSPHLNPSVEKFLLERPFSKDDMAWHHYMCEFQPCPYLSVCDRCQHIIVQGEPSEKHQSCPQIRPVRSHREEESFGVDITKVRIPADDGSWRVVPREEYSEATESSVDDDTNQTHITLKKKKRFESRVKRMTPHIEKWLTEVKSQEDVIIQPTSVVFTNQTPQKVAERDILMHMWETVDYKIMFNRYPSKKDFAVQNALRTVFTHKEIPPPYLEMLNKIEEVNFEITQEEKDALYARRMKNCDKISCGTEWLPCAKHLHCEIHPFYAFEFAIQRYISIHCSQCKQARDEFNFKYPIPKEDNEDETMAPWNHLDEMNFPYSSSRPRYSHDKIRKLRMNPFCPEHKTEMFTFKWDYCTTKKCFSCTIQGW